MRSVNSSHTGVGKSSTGSSFLHPSYMRIIYDFWFVIDIPLPEVESMDPGNITVVILNNHTLYTYLSLVAPHTFLECHKPHRLWVSIVGLS